MKKLIPGGIITTAILISTLMYSSAAHAQKPAESKQPPPTDELIIKKRAAEPAGGLITGLSGGYFSPLGTEGEMLESSWSIKAFVYNNAIGGKALGIGFEAGYADLKDKENSGGIKYIPTIGYVTLTWNIFGIIEMQPKAGAGLTTMLAEIDNGIRVKKDYSIDFTLSLGFGVLKTFYKHYFAGMDYEYYYIFERDPSKAQGVNFFAGYKF